MNRTDKKALLLDLKDFFERYTGENNELSIKHIVNKFGEYVTQKYNNEITITDETIIKYIKILNNYGFEIIENTAKYGKKLYSNFNSAK